MSKAKHSKFIYKKPEIFSLFSHLEHELNKENKKHLIFSCNLAESSKSKDKYNRRKLGQI